MLKRQREGQRRTVDMVKKRDKMPGEEDSRKKKGQKDRNSPTKEELER